jgi:hypothetical protein
LVIYQGKDALQPISAQSMVDHIDERGVRNDPRLESIRTRSRVNYVSGMLFSPILIASLPAIAVEANEPHPKFEPLPLIGLGVAAVAAIIAFVAYSRPSHDDFDYWRMRDPALGQLPIYYMAWRFLKAWPEILTAVDVAREPTVFEVRVTATKLRRVSMTREL